MKKYLPKIILLLIVLILIVVLKSLGLTSYLTLDYLKANLDNLQQVYDQNVFLTLAIYIAVYITITALSLPGGATVLTLAGGAVFGFWIGLIVVSFASTIGATLAFLIARFLLRDFIQEKFEDKLDTLNQGFEKDGAFYLLTLRLVPIFPFFLINLVMGLTPIKILTFFLVSQLGMLLGTAIYVNAGLQISQVDSLQGILSPTLLMSLALLGVLPLIAKYIVKTIKAKD